MRTRTFGKNFSSNPQPMAKQNDVAIFELKGCQAGEFARSGLFSVKPLAKRGRNVEDRPLSYSIRHDDCQGGDRRDHSRMKAQGR